MRTTMSKKDLKKSDGFSPNIDRDKTVVVQVTSEIDFSTVLYTNKAGRMDKDVIAGLWPKYAEGIYIVKK